MKIFISLILSLFFSTLYAACIVKDSRWTSSETSCKSGFVNGVSTAYHHNGKLKFEGTFKKGLMVKGTVFYKNKPYYVGNIVKNEMHGQGICYFREKPEKCEYYKGDRVDAIYKLRFLMRQQLLAIQVMVNEQREQIQQSSMNNQTQGQHHQTQEQSTGTDVGGRVIQKVTEKVTEKAVDMILDQFF